METSSSQVTPYQWQWLVKGVQVQSRLAGPGETDLLKLRRDNASLCRTELVRAASVEASLYIKKDKMTRSHERGIVLHLDFTELQSPAART